MLKVITSPRRPDITVYASGRINLTARVVALLRLHDGDSLNVAYDPPEILIFADQKASPQARFFAACHPSNPRNASKPAYYYTNSRPLATAILQHAALTDTPRAGFFTGYPVELEGTVYLPVITRNPQP